MTDIGERLRSLVRLRDGLPADYRFAAWKYLLDLPGNSSSFLELVRRGPHPAAIASLAARYPLRDRALFRKTAVLISALAHWSPLLGEAEFIPAWVFPFVVVFQKDDLGAFEAAMTFLLHWGSRLLVTFPQPPVPVLAAVELLLQGADPKLAAHLRGLSVGALSYGWPLLRSAFCEVLHRDDWLRLLDHLFTKTARLDLLEVGVVAFVVSSRATLLRCRSHRQAVEFFRQPHLVDMDRMFREMKRVAKLAVPSPRARNRAAGSRDRDDTAAATPMAQLRSATREFKPLPRGAYPTFDGYPEIVINYQAELRQRVTCQEQAFENKQQLAEELAQRAQAIAKRESALEEEEKLVPGELELEEAIRYASGQEAKSRSSNSVHCGRYILSS